MRYTSIAKQIVWALVLVTAALGLQAQSPSGWNLVAPSESIQLNHIEEFNAGLGKRFTFKNVSGRTIIELRISSPGGTTVGLDAFMTGAGAVGPNSEVDMTFSASDFALSGTQKKELRVEAIIYQDGTCIGNKQELSEVLDEMVGATLATKRALQTLDLAPDKSLSGVEDALSRVRLEKVNSHSPESLRGISVEGVPQFFVNQHLDNGTKALKTGASGAFDIVLLNLTNAKSTVERWNASTHGRSKRAQQAASQLVSDVSSEVQSRLSKQAIVLKSLKGCSNVE